MQMAELFFASLLFVGLVVLLFTFNFDNIACGHFYFQFYKANKHVVKCISTSFNLLKVIFEFCKSVFHPLLISTDSITILILLKTFYRKQISHLSLMFAP
jgi:hypothetical protein